MNLYRQESYSQSAKIESIEVWESLLSSCGDAIDVSILQLARAGYTKRETAAHNNISLATVYRRLQDILARYKRTTA